MKNHSFPQFKILRQSCTGLTAIVLRNFENLLHNSHIKDSSMGNGFGMCE